MTLFRRRRSRIQRVVNRAQKMRQRLPSTPAVPGFDLPSVSRPELPSLPSKPDLNMRKIRKRVSRDTGGDTPLLSLAGGLLLGLFVGIVVAVILISRTEDEDASSARHTGITLLPQHEGEEGESATGDKSAAGAG